MKRLTQKEFFERTEALMKARKIFIPHITKNITIAFELYQELLAEQERSIFLSTINEGRVERTWLDAFKRPKCPRCREGLRLRVIDEPKGPRNRRGWKTCWECPGPMCIYEGYSKKNLNEWLKRLKKKEGEGV